MADVFISYSSKHRDLTERLARVIEAAHGSASVWWDRELTSGDRFRPEITAALDKLRAAVVVWTDGAVDSDWVYAEAVRAAAQRKVVTVREASLDPGRIPLPFNVFHTDPVDMRGSGDAQLLAAIARRLGGEPSPMPADLPGAGFRAYLLDPRQEALPPWAAAKRPASLLLAKHRLVPYDDIHGFVDEMVEWSIGSPTHAMDSPVLGRLVHGPGGLGKTRALIEVADTLAREHGWLAGFVPRGAREEAKAALESLLARGGQAAGLLIVLDYAEGRQGDAVWLAERIAARGATVGRPARLVLLSRGAGDWWAELLRKSQSLQDLMSLGGGAYDVRELPERIARGDRLAMFDRAAESFVAFRRKSEPGLAPLRAPSQALADSVARDDDYDRPLAVQMAALLYAMGYDAGENRAGMAGLIEKVLGLEYEHWDKALALDPKSNWPRAIKRGVAQVTLVGGVDEREAAERLLAGDPVYGQARDIDVPRAYGHLALIFPGGRSGLAALEPDLIGEQHVAEAADDGLVGACLDWAGEDRTKRRAVLTVLNRATRPEHGAAADRAGKRLQNVVAARGGALAADLVATAVGTPGGLIGMLDPMQVIVPDLDEDALEALDAELPMQSLALMDLSLAVAQRRLELARHLRSAADAADTSAHLREALLSHQAARSGTLGIRLSSLGRREQALAASQEAVDIYRALAKDRPDAFLPDLAMSLNNLGGDLSNLGRREQALAASQEAVDIRRVLAKDRPDAFLPDLATSISVVSDVLAALGRPAEAAAAATEALETLAPFVDRYPENFRDLAQTFGSDMLKYSQAAAVAPDKALLERVERAIKPR